MIPSVAITRRIRMIAHVQKMAKKFPEASYKQLYSPSPAAGELGEKSEADHLWQKCIW